VEVAKQLVRVNEYSPATTVAFSTSYYGYGASLMMPTSDVYSTNGYSKSYNEIVPITYLNTELVTLIKGYVTFDQEGKRNGPYSWNGIRGQFKNNKKAGKWVSVFGDALNQVVINQEYNDNGDLVKEKSVNSESGEVIQLEKTTNKKVTIVVTAKNDGSIQKELYTDMGNVIQKDIYINEKLSSIERQSKDSSSRYVYDAKTGKVIKNIFESSPGVFSATFYNSKDSKPLLTILNSPRTQITISWSELEAEFPTFLAFNEDRSASKFLFTIVRGSHEYQLFREEGEYYYDASVTNSNTKIPSSFLAGKCTIQVLRRNSKAMIFDIIRVIDNNDTYLYSGTKDFVNRFKPSLCSK
jgi:hypothetical protein